MELTRLVWNTASLPFRILDTGVRTAAIAATAGVGLVTNPVRAASALPTGIVAALSDVATEILGGPPSRRYWLGEHRCWVEVRGLSDTTSQDALGKHVLTNVLALPGIQSARLNFPLSRVVIDADGTASMDEICDAVAAAERDADVDAAQLATDLPPDPIVLASGVTAAAASAIGLAITLAGRAVPFPRMLPDLAAVVSVVDYQPRLRRLLEQRLGASAADTAIALAASIGYTLGQLPASLAVDLCMHLLRVAETQSSAAVWRRREAVLAVYAEACDDVRPSDRPRPPPAGPIERHGDRSGAVQGLGAVAVGVASGGVDAGATAALVAVPKAARNSREAFASALARGLADHHEVVPVRPEVLRRLDRVDAVVIDPRVLWTEELRVGRIRGVADDDRAAAWQWAQGGVERGTLKPGWHPIPSRNGHSAAGVVLVRFASDPLALVLLREIRRSTAEVVSIDVDGLDDLRSFFDELDPHDGALDSALSDAVRRLQHDGRTVAAVSATAAQALADADVAVGVFADGPCWHADLLADDLAGVWRIMHALSAARRASERGVQLAAGASVLGALLMVPGVRGRGPGPVTIGAGAGAWIGFRTARDVLRDETPEPAPMREWHALSVDQVKELLPPPERTTVLAAAARTDGDCGHGRAASCDRSGAHQCRRVRGGDARGVVRPVDSGAGDRVRGERRARFSGRRRVGGLGADWKRGAGRRSTPARRTPPAPDACGTGSIRAPAERGSVGSQGLTTW